ncbi:M14 family metallopeptidase [Cytophagales bacterium LB-30]|uniref:M14 family metallopeptidase n=1 Tax=Shiella aurantiaca TaxID=3058365 RepID=A0ABT8F5W0_9BACT|nr:M14 family metallopeptidase [Shiella aurantiaca]MDN4165659.1 M14 family metallopeptidase [Shiella aurantiaca]
MKAFFLLIGTSLCLSLIAQGQVTMFEQSQGKKTPSYPEIIAWWTGLDQNHEEISMRPIGLSDSGEPLHLILLSTSKHFSPEQWEAEGKTVVFINNGIHPGEPDGIDASMLFVRNILQSKKLKEEYRNLVFAIIPVYNVGGAINRNSHSRANQNGPEAHGFRGNAQNYDLNRDFIKMDTRNAQSFVEIFQWLKPQLYLETHVSNGADYQYALTLLPTQENKLGGASGTWLREHMLPALFSEMEKKKEVMTPYVNVWGSTPDKGWTQFVDWPRYSTGYVALQHTIGFMTETHMLKPYEQRVNATLLFMQTLADFAQANGPKIKALQASDRAAYQKLDSVPINWTVDKSQSQTLNFKGYEGRYEPSKVTTGQRLYYDKEKPYTREVSFYNTYIASNYAVKPRYFLIPQGWHRVVERLKVNGVQMQALTQDSTVEVVETRISSFETYIRPFEGHYLHYNTQVSEKVKQKTFRKGDWLISLNQPAARYLMETLSPEAPDSFFNWNFFDTILQQKEGYSDYVFEDKAEELLKSNSELKRAFEEKKAGDAAFAADAEAQLDYIYRNSPHYEEAHMTLPIYQIR